VGSTEGGRVSDDPTNVWAWLVDSSQRTVSGSIPSQLATTLLHSVSAFAIACALAIPIAAWLAHRRRAEVVATAVVNLGRVIPTITILGFAVLISLRNGFGFEPWPIIFALVALALPPLFANTYTAVREASPEAVGAARALGMSERQILRSVELPLALPLILATARVTLTQVVATEALGALFGSGGLGIYVRFGFASSDVVEIQAGALLVAGTAMAVDLLLWLAIRFGLPQGLRPPEHRRARRAPSDPGRQDLTLIPKHQPL
jgi:osmoprotectant transport system permease protein